MPSHEQCLQHRQRPQFGKARNVQPIVGKHQVDTSVALCTRELKQAHRLKIHAHQQTDLLGFMRLQEVFMQGKR